MVAETHITYQGIQALLTELNRQGGFLITVLTDQNGLPIASSTRAMDDSDTQAAVVAQVQKVTSQVRDQLGMAAAEEISLNDINGKKLICRPFSIDGSEFILAVLIPSRDKAYRRLTNLAINVIQHSWDVS